MFLIPFGLGLKLRNHPWVTYLIIALCAVNYFAIQKSELDRGSKELVKVIKEQEEAVSSDGLYYEYCLAYAKNPSFSCSSPEKKTEMKGDEEVVKKPERPEPDFKGITSILDDTQLRLDFQRELEDEDSKVTSLESYPDYAKDVAAFKERKQKVYTENNWLSKGNFNFYSVFWAAFSHGSLMHLIGNMFFLFIFGRYVEATVGKVFYLFSYLVFGTAGLAAYAWFDLGGNHVLGASANVFAIMGMFYVLFFHFRMKVGLWYMLVIYQKMTLNVKFFFPLFFLAQEIVLSFSYTVTGVAHKAHFYGLVFGALIALVWKKLNPMPKSFLYKDEFEFWNEIKDTVSTRDFIVEANKILKYNPHNQEVKTFMLERLLSKDDDLEDIHAYRYLENLLPYYLIDNIEDEENYDVIYRTLDLVPFEVSFLRYFQFVGQKQILAFLDHSIDNKKVVHSMKLIQLYFEKYRTSRKLKSLERTLYSIFDFLDNEDQVDKMVHNMKEYTVSKKFRKTLIKYQQLKGGESAHS